MLVRLGTNIFPDVSYRTSFGILMLERRPERIKSAEDSEVIPYTDLRYLAANSPNNELGTVADPRLRYLRKIVRNEEKLEVTEYHAPSPVTRFSFYPGGDITSRFKGSASLHEDSGEHLFINRYPGIITAFDVLFKGDTREELKEKLTSLYGICRKKISAADLVRQLDQWARERGFDGRECEVLQILGTQIHRKNLAFDPEQIKLSFSGSIPESAKWYPPVEYIHYLYYEPILRVPRKENPGKPVGWGSMNQWREPRSHKITPKLIYTTAKTPRHGYAAFVTKDEWYVKLHGGTSQQFNYTGLEDPILSQRMDGMPNNLTHLGLQLYTRILGSGGVEDSLLYYIAGIWNSDLAKELLSDVGTSMRPGIRIPNNSDEEKLAIEIAENARLARDIAHLNHLLSVDEQLSLAQALDRYFDRQFLSEFGVVQVVEKSKRFSAQAQYVIPSDLKEQLAEKLESVETQINSLVELLYS